MTRQRPQSGTIPLDLGKQGQKKKTNPQNGQNRLTKSAAGEFLQSFSCPTAAHRRIRGWRFLKYFLRSGGDPNPGEPTAWRGSACLHLAAPELARGSSGLNHGRAGSSSPATSSKARSGLSPARYSPSSDYNKDIPADSKRDYTEPGCVSAVFSHYQACRRGATPEN